MLGHGLSLFAGEESVKYRERTRGRNLRDNGRINQPIWQF